MAGDTIDKVIKIAMTLGLLFLVYLVIAGIITLVLWGRVGQGDPKGFWYTDRDKLKKYIFKSWINWAGSPSTFSYLSTPAFAVSSTVYKTFSNASVRNCMLQCESANSRGKTAKCVGFDFLERASNTCTLYSSMDGIVATPVGNTLYFIDGLDTAREYVPYGDKTMPTLESSNIIGTSTDLGCFSNCSSNASCTGLLYSNTSTCVLFSTPFDSTKLIAEANTTTYTITTHSALTTSPIRYY
jgi:hypothetical protein